MVLLDRCQSLCTRMEHHETLHRSAVDAEPIRQRAAELDNVAAHLDEIVVRIAELRNVRDLLQPLESRRLEELPDPAHVRKVVTTLRDALEHDLDRFRSRRDFGRFARSLKQLIEEAQAVLDDVLASIRRGGPSIDASLLSDLATVPEYAAPVTEVRRLRDELLNWRPFEDSDAIAGFLDRRERLRRIVGELEDSKLPEDVRGFLRAAQARNGASVDLLNNEVRAWLMAHNMLDRVRLIWIEEKTR